MNSKLVLKGLGLLLVCAGAAGGAQAVTQPVTFNLLTASGTVSTPLGVGDVLRLDTLVTTETGALLQNITFSLAAGVTNLVGEAAWEISTAIGTAPRLIGVNIDIFDSSNALVMSDTAAGVLGGFAVSTFSGAIGPGTYTMRATGTGVRASSLDVTLAFAGVVPEPHAAVLMAGGLLALLALRRQQRARQS